VGTLMPLAIFGVEKALIAHRALVRPLGTIEMSLRMTPESMSMGVDKRGSGHLL
jgi:hypothetical protein